MPRLLIVDDHPIVRRGLSNLLHDTLPDIAVDEAGSGREGLRAVAAAPYDAVLLDISLPDLSGLEVLRELKDAHPSLPVLVISIHDEERYAVRALRSGAAGYLKKSSAPEELVAAVSRVLAGRRYVTPELAERLVELLDGHDEAVVHERLSDREFDVMLALARGDAVGDIARRLCLSPKTVSTYRTRVLEKMGLQTNADLTRYALERGLLD